MPCCAPGRRAYRCSTRFRIHSAPGRGPRGWTRHGPVGVLLVSQGGEAVMGTLAGSCRCAEENATEELRYGRVAMLVTPLLGSALEQLGFERAAYDYPVLLQPSSADLRR